MILILSFNLSSEDCNTVPEALILPDTSNAYAGGFVVSFTLIPTLPVWSHINPDLVSITDEPENNATL